MTGIEEAREALAKWDRSSFPDVGYAYLAESLRALIAEVDRLSVPPSDDEREALDQIIRDADGWWPDAREAILATFRRQGPITYARPWRPEDGDTRCQACGRRNPVWWANNDDWNALMPDDGILCPSCYHSRWLEAAERARSAVPSTAEQEHDPRCISLTDSEFNGSCDCRTLRMIDEHDAHRSTEQESER